MNYPTYTDYKDSGIEWLGEIPEHWSTVKSKYVFKRKQRPVRESDGIITAFRDGQVTLRSNRRTEGFTMASKEIGYQGVRVGDLLIHAMDGFAGAIGVSDSEGKCSPVCSVCVPINPDEIHVPYYGYLVRQLAVTEYITSLAKGIRERSTEFRYSEFSNLPIAIPPLEEQQKIVDFLATETARTDTLIKRSEQLISLLQEKRQAMISHAVTKGLEPNVPMKDSGIEWLGKIPEHWEVKRVKHILNILTDYTANGSFADLKKNVTYLDTEDYSRLIRLTDLRKGLKESGVWVSKDSHDYLKKSEVFAGDVLMANVGAYTGHSFIIPKDYNYRATLAPNMFLLRFKERIVSREYAFNIMNSIGMVEYLSTIAFSAAQPKLNKPEVKNAPVCYPPNKDEQSSIVNFIAENTLKIDSLIDKAQQQIEKLKEHRSALISAAVTGKIDVREWNKKEKAA